MKEFLVLLLPELNYSSLQLIFCCTPVYFFFVSSLDFIFQSSVKIVVVVVDV